MKIRRAEISDAEAIAKVSADTWQQAYRGIMSDEILAERRCSPERIESWRRRVKDTLNGATAIYVAEDENGKVVGFAWGGVSKDNQVPRNMELYAFYVHPNFQKKGYGQALFETFRKYSTGRFYLYALQDNKKAADFYQKMGGVLMPEYAKDSPHSGHQKLKEACYFFE